MTATELHAKYKADLQALQDSCTHEVLSDWMEQQWAPGHSTGKQVKVCECCNKVIETKGGSFYEQFMIQNT